MWFSQYLPSHSKDCLKRTSIILPRHTTLLPPDQMELQTFCPFRSMFPLKKAQPGDRNLNKPKKRCILTAPHNHHSKTTSHSSALPAKALDQESKLIGPLAKSSTLKLFIPSDFGNNWSPSEISSAETLAPLKAKSEIVDQLNKNNVPIALIKVGLFAEFAFGYQ